MSCDGKRAWRSERQARRAAKLVTDSAGQLFRAYRCDVCGMMHLSSQPKLEPVPAAPKVNRPRRRPPKARTLDELQALAERMRGA